MRALLAVLFFCAGTAWGQQYPAKPVKLLVGFAPGGGTDLVARLMAAKLTERWNQAVVVENKLGASGNIAAEQVAKSAPDGYTLLMAFSSHASNAALSRLPFDIEKDFSAITLVGSAPMVVAANPALSAKTPAPIVTRLSDAINKALADPIILKRLQDAGVDPTPGGTPEKLAQFIKAELAKWAPIIKASGAHVD